MKRAFIVIDMQNDFVTGSLGFENAIEIEKYIYDYLKKEFNNNDQLIFTRDTHTTSYLETREGRNLPVLHCIKDTDGWEIVEILKPFINDDTLIFDKPTFGSLELGNFLRAQHFDEIHIMGLVSNICVLSNAIIAKAALPEAEILVHKKLTDSFDERRHLETLSVLEGVQIRIV